MKTGQRKDRSAAGSSVWPTWGTRSGWTVCSRWRWNNDRCPGEPGPSCRWRRRSGSCNTHDRMHLVFRVPFKAFLLLNSSCLFHTFLSETVTVCWLRHWRTCFVQHFSGTAAQQVMIKESLWVDICKKGDLKPAHPVTAHHSCRSSLDCFSSLLQMRRGHKSRSRFTLVFWAVFLLRHQLQQVERHRLWRNPVRH